MACKVCCNVAKTMQVPLRQNEDQVDPIARGACDVAAGRRTPALMRWAVASGELILRKNGNPKGRTATGICLSYDTGRFTGSI
jgi:hypothetical protein